MQFLSKVKIKDIVDFSGPLIESTLGSLDREILFFDSLKANENDSFCFITNVRHLETIEQSNVCCILAPLNLKDKISSLKQDKTWLFSKNVELCARNIKNQFVFKTPYRPPFHDIHPTAVIDSSVKIGKKSIIAPYAIIGKNVTIGSGCFIGSHSVIEENAVIKNNVTIHPHVYIGHSCEIGNDCEIKPQAVIGSEGFGYSHDHLGNHYRVPHTGRVILHDDVHVGAGTAIDRGTLEDSIVGQGTKIDNQCHLAHNTVVGKNGLLTAQLVTAGSSIIGDNFICGGKTAITGHIKITDNVHLAGFSAVTNNITEPGQYGGHPLLPLQKNLKVKVLTSQLPEMKKQINKMYKKLFPEEN
jgi:UDP-3-O-[3-hydroxymyristoyl] glucosamine N-acyltransferase